MDTADAKRPDARRQAEDRFAKIIRRDAEVRAYQQQLRDAEAAKIARLRALRLAKEAAEAAKPRATPKKAAHASRTRAAKPAADGGRPESNATSSSDNKA